MSDGQRKAAIGGTAIAAVLSVFAVGSMATAELQQNDVQRALDEGAAFTCDTARDFDCDGQLDVDENGDPLGAAEPDGANVDENTTEAGDADTDTAPADGSVVDPAGDGATPVPASTAPTTTVPAPAPPALLAVGDSVMLGAAQQLSELGFTVDAAESRAWVNGLDAVETLARQDRLPETLLIHLGTNGPIGSNDMDRMMTAVASVPKVILVTNDVDRDYTADNNSLIVGAGGSNDNVEVLYWDGLTSSCPGDCFEADGFHLKPDGRAYYAQLIDGLLSS
jgi:hypothetical protein